MNKQTSGSRMAQISAVAFVLALTLASFGETIQGAKCPARKAYVPEYDMGDLQGPWPKISTFPNYTERGDFDSQHPWRLAVGMPGAFYEDCCPTGRISEWRVYNSYYFNWVAQVNFTCTDGYQGSSVLYGYNSTFTNGTLKWCNQRLSPGASANSIFQPDTEGVFPFSSGDYVQSFMGIGDSIDSTYNAYQNNVAPAPTAPASATLAPSLDDGNDAVHDDVQNNTAIRLSKGPYYAYQNNAVSCPAGTRAIGIGARSSCYALINLQVICAKTNATTNNTGAASQRNGQCAAKTYVPQVGSNTTLGNPRAWAYTRVALERAVSNASGVVQSDCCNPGEGIANWTIAPAALPKYSYYYTNYVQFNVGYLQGQCTDGSLLSPIIYGQNGTFACNLQSLDRVYHYNSPADQKYYYSNSALASDGSGELVTFMYPQANYSTARPFLQCPSGQVAVGYTAQSGCYSLTNVTIMCGTVSASANAILTAAASPVSNPPYNGEDGMCSNGVSMVPNTTYAATNYRPIGVLSSWADFKDASNMKIYSGNPGPFISTCCAKGHGIVSFNVWPSDNRLSLVGSLSAKCTDGKTTSRVTLGFNSTDIGGKPLFCSNKTKTMQNIPLENGIVTYRGNSDFQALLEWPSRGESDYGSLDPMRNLTCANGQYPIGWGARSSCFELTDFRIICGQKQGIPFPTNSSAAGTAGAIRSPDSPGIGSGGVAGIVVGSVAGLAVILLVAGFFAHRRYQAYKKRTRIESRLLFDLNGPEGFHNGVTTTSATTNKGASIDSMDSGKSRFIQTELMTIEDINRSEDNTPVAFEGIPVEWEIQSNQLKLHCIDGKPIELGRGGYGVVLYGTVHQEDAAIKMIKGRGKESELLREIAILERAKTQFVVRFLGYSICPSGILLCMEYLPGVGEMNVGTLWEALAAGREEYQWYNRGCQAFTDICKGLYMLHINFICHLDMKTPNVLISNEGMCKISDLGLGKLLKAGATTVTADAMGSLAWMSPEQIVGRCGLPSDIWALSTILWEICTLRRPTREAQAADIQIPEQAPPEVVDLLARCRADNPRERPGIGEICDIVNAWNKNSSCWHSWSRGMTSQY